MLVLVGCWNDEIARRRGFGPAKPKIEHSALSFCWGCTNWSADDTGGVEGGADALIKVLGAHNSTTICR